VLGCIRGVVVLVLIVVLAAVVFLFRGRIMEKIHGGSHAVAVAPSAAVGDSAYQKLDDLRAAKTDRVAMSTVELQSLVQYKYPGLLPAFAREPHIELSGDHVKLKARVPADKLPSIKGLGDAAAFLPDTADVSLSGTLIPLPSGRVGLGVDAVQVAGIPLPSRLIHDGLRRVGRKSEPGLPDDAIGVSLPEGVKSAYIRNDSLILLGRSKN
jgi:hypothetical protein